MVGRCLVQYSVKAVSLTAVLSECVPARLADGGTDAFGRIEIGSTGRTQAPALLPAETECWCVQEPVLTNSLPEIELPRARLDRIHVGVIRIARFSKDEMDLLAHVG